MPLSVQEHSKRRVAYYYDGKLKSLFSRLLLKKFACFKDADSMNFIVTEQLSEHLLRGKTLSKLSPYYNVNIRINFQRKIEIFAANVGNYYYGQGHVMKPHRIRMTHHLLLNYGIYRNLEVYVSNPVCETQFYF